MFVLRMAMLPRWHRWKGCRYCHSNWLCPPPWSFAGQQPMSLIFQQFGWVSGKDVDGIGKFMENLVQVSTLGCQVKTNAECVPLVSPSPG